MQFAVRRIACEPSSPGKVHRARPSTLADENDGATEAGLALHEHRMLLRMARAWALSLACLLTACGIVAREPLLPALVPPQARVQAEDAGEYRMRATDSTTHDRFLRRWEQDMAQSSKDGVVALGISGGGSLGAYGAGVVTGWTQADRPDLTLVTGVSTGAMIAPFAFAGPAWDDALRRAFLDPDTAGLTVTGLGIVGRPSVYSGIPLTRLVTRHASPELVAAIAQRHREGARLLIATTDIDTLETVIWNMGAIAVTAQDPNQREQALHLFRSVIVASASVPGYFPPVVLAAGGRSEVHVDGAVNAPLFLLPEAAAMMDIPGRLRPLRLYVVINGSVDAERRPLRGGAFTIIGRAITSMGRATIRAHLQLVGLFARRHGASFRFTAAPDDFDLSPLRFDTAQMQRLYGIGYDAGRGRTAFARAYP